MKNDGGEASAVTSAGLREDVHSPMSFRIGRLFVWFLAGYFLLFRLREVLIKQDLPGEFADYFDPHILWLKVSGLVVFFSYSLAQYALLYFGYFRLRWYLLIPAQVALMFVCIFFRAFVEEGLIKAITGVGNYNPEMNWENYLIDNLYYVIIFCSVAAVYYFFQLAGYNATARQRSELLRREAEIRFLRSQVNPHFLFNTLNNLYSLVNDNSPQALPVLEKLSGLLRYSLYEQAATVPLERELAYLRDLIELESLRLPGVVPPVLEVGPFTREWSLPPLLLVPFVENAFKHGDLCDGERPLSIRVRETGVGLQLIFQNAVRPVTDFRDGVGGIGLENVRKRLELLYPGRHIFRQENSGVLFTVYLELFPSVVDILPSEPLRANP